MRTFPLFRLSISLLTILWLSSYQNVVHAAPLNLVDAPLFVSASASPLTMLVMGRDHKLYYEAYNDASDLNNDGTIDVGYQPDIDYFGYFDSHLCYKYSSSLFSPSRKTTNKTCTTNGEWSGDFLNYVTTARIDALRKVLYGGYRSIDTGNKTILQRTHIPQDAHAWGKSYDPTRDTNYSISDYTPLSEPANGYRHIFSNVSLSNNGQPLMRVLNDTQFEVWDWLSIEGPISGIHCKNHSTSCSSNGSQIEDYAVNIEVCVSSDDRRTEEGNCHKYSNGKYKPTGLLQRYGENDSMMFGLITGSYENNTQGGVLRKNISSLTDEINSDNGTFESTVGIIKTIDRLKTYGFTYTPEGDGDSIYNCGWIVDRAINNGECSMWGNPIGEIMYESLRYFAGQNPTPEFIYGSNSIDSQLGLPLETWKDPYDTYEHCAKPFQLVISDINPSYDSDSVPGSAFSSWTDSNLSFNAQTEATTITANESDIYGERFIGYSIDDTETSATPAPKNVQNLGRIQGLAPEEPTKEGSYYSASAAYYGWKTDIGSAIKDQHLTTFAVALASPLPEITIPVTGGKVVTLIPFAKSFNNFGISPGPLDFQPTNQIVDFYIESLDTTSGSFLVNFEDVEQGADHDMDAIVRYHYEVNGNAVIISMESLYSAGTIDQHMGYVISGTTRDGVYLDVRDTDGSNTNYYLDTPPPTYKSDGSVDIDGIWAGGRGADTRILGLTSKREFIAGSTTGVSALKGPLWYAAKWGGFNDENENNLPDKTSEWDENGDGNPDNYFLVTNALKLSEQLETAFDEITSRTGSAATVTVNSGSLNTNTLLYQATFDTEGWSGSVKAFKIGLDATLATNATWDAKDKINKQKYSTGREIITYNTEEDTGIAFRWPSNYLNPQSDELSLTASNTLLNNISSDQQNYGQDILNYIRGDRSEEVGTASSTRSFRTRTSALGDIVHSNPLYVGPPTFFFPDKWDSIDGINAPENSASQKYSEFRSTFKERPPVLYFGANDGMLHAIDATLSGGNELLAYIPSTTYPNLAKLTSPSYNHKYFVDGPAAYGDTFFNNNWHTVLIGTLRAGGQGIFALDITNPNDTTISGYPVFAESNASKLALWEFTDADDADLGYTYGQASIVRMANGKWAAVFGNGFNNTHSDGRVSDTGNAVIFIVDIENGNLIAKLDTEKGIDHDPLNTDRPNGISAATPVDVNGDSIVDYIYAGDLFGNVWKFDVSSANILDWKSAFLSGTVPEPLFVATDSSGKTQPITTKIQVSTHPKFKTTDDFMVYFGTGKYLEAEDSNANNEVTQTFYGVWDNGARLLNRNFLIPQTILEERTLDSTGSFRLISDNDVNWSSPATDRGWRMDLVNTQINNNKGERQVSNAIIRNGRIIFTTLIPSGDICEAGGSGWLMELDANNGGALESSPFDTNGDGVINAADLLLIDGVPVSPAGYSSPDTGITSAPAIVTNVTSNNTENKFLSTSSGSILNVLESGSNRARGRQSWREVH